MRGVPIRTGTLQDAAFPEGRFDFIHSSHLIEHVPEPGEFLAEVFRVLKPGGYCVTVTPNRDGLQARLFGGGWRSVIADHVHLFSRSGLIRLTRAWGFTAFRTVTWGGIALGMAPAPVKAALDRSAKAFGFGDVVAVLARKPEQCYEACEGASGKEGVSGIGTGGGKPPGGTYALVPFLPQSVM
ncbi:MAG: class I SAM-dependent methyltransferase [Chromatiales bacterium]|nr:class I SAM-dependent methyltransferase [Chromatiales bacterium]